MSNLNRLNSASILLFSLPRSGSTWIGKILDSHPDTLYRHEPDSVCPISGIPLFPVETEGARLYETFRSYHDSVTEMNAAKICGKAPLFPKAYFGLFRLYCYRFVSQSSKVLDRFGINMPIFGVPVGRTNVRLIWKSIESLGRLGIAMKAIPSAYGILLLRHPCGYVASVMRGQARQKFEDNADSSEDYGVFEMLLETDYARERGLTMQELQSMLPEERLAWRWALVNTKAIRDTEGHRSRCYLLSYDEFCADPLKGAEALFEFLGLSWSQQTQTFISESIGKHRDSYYAIRKDPKIAANSWRNELDSEIVDKIMEIAGQSDAGALFGR